MTDPDPIVATMRSDSSLRPDRPRKCLASPAPRTHDSIMIPDGHVGTDYFSPSFFDIGQRVRYGEFVGTIVRHYHEGMWEVRLPGGVTCVSGADLEVLA